MVANDSIHIMTIKNNVIVVKCERALKSAIVDLHKLFVNWKAFLSYWSF